MTDPAQEQADAEIRAQALAYLNGELSVEEVEALQARLVHEPGLLERYWACVQLEAIVRETVQRGESIRRELSLPSDRDVKFDEIIASLTPPEDLPPIEIFPPIPHDPAGPADPASQITFVQAVGLIGYALRRSRAAMLTAGAIAAVLIVAVTLYLVLDSGAERPIVAGGDGTGQEAGGRFESVATLSDEKGALWRVGSGAKTPSVGESLYAGQRLTLISGTAQLTTRRGAIANLQSPCTIQLLEGGNALRLEYGRVVGICETQASQGFLVRTAQASVTDLGTRFGVDATREDVTEVHLFEGEVRVVVPDAGPAIERERVLTAGQAVAARGSGERFVEITSDVDRFASIQAKDLAPIARVTQIMGVRSLSGDVQQADASQFVGRAVMDWPTGEDAYVFHDFVGGLRTDAAVNVSEPGEFKQLGDSTMSPVAAGTNLRSYIIIKNGGLAETGTSVRGSVTFEHEVIGIITDEEAAAMFASAIRATSPVFTPGAGADRWIDPYTFNEGVSLSEDRRTVTFQYEVKQSTDTIRVLVRTE